MCPFFYNIHNPSHSLLFYFCLSFYLFVHCFWFLFLYCNLSLLQFFFITIFLWFFISSYFFAVCFLRSSSSLLITAFSLHVNVQPAVPVYSLLPHTGIKNRIDALADTLSPEKLTPFLHRAVPLNRVEILFVSLAFAFPVSWLLLLCRRKFLLRLNNCCGLYLRFY